MDASDIATRLDFIRSAERLKNVLRSGFSSAGRPESTPEHTWRLCLLAMVFQDGMPGLHFERLLKMCVVHDLGEALHGDVPAPQQGADKSKAFSERADLIELLAPLPPHVREELLALWDEYEAGTSPEAVAVKAFDKIETVLQHAQGDNPADFDYAFNLGYGTQYTSATPLLAEIRRQADEHTHKRMDLQGEAARDCPTGQGGLTSQEENRGQRMETEPLEALDPQPSFKGYSHAVLEAQFKQIQPELHWKAPIESVVPAGADLNCIEAAIIYFTGSSGEFIKENGIIKVIAPGYWASQE